MHALKTKPKVFLADLIHNQYAYSYCVPLNIGCLEATLEKKFGDAVDIRLFKFPDRLIKALNQKPDILALSNYDWNVNLNKALIQMARRQNPDVFVVMGGPNIRRRREGIQQFLKERSYIDAYVLYEGEDAFAGIIEHLLGREGHLRDTLIKERVELPQVAYLACDDDSLVMGPLCASIRMKDIPHPSAWLSGHLDSYLNNRSFRLFPVIETTRGCPYACTYCTAWGNSAIAGVKMVRQYNLETVFEELEYIFKKAEQEFFMMVTDANTGILERDLQVAEKIRRLADRYGKITALSLDTSPYMLERNIEIHKILGNLSIPIFAQQTFNEDILINIKRKNVSFERVKMLVDTIHAHGSSICTDLLVGLPGESKEAHINSIKMAFEANFDKFQIADIRLLHGSEMEEEHSRKKYGLRTKYRIIPNAFGLYNGEKVIDYENCIRETSAMSGQEFLELRLLHAHIFLMLNLEIGRPLLDFARNHGLHQLDLIADITRMPPKDKYPTLERQFSDYMNHSSSEWFDTQEEADAYYMQEEVFNKLYKDGFPKLNYEYASNLIINRILLKEFLGWITHNIEIRLPEVNPLLVKEIVSFTEKRIISFPIEDGVAEPMEMSGAALKDLERHIGGYCPDVSPPSQKQLVEFVADKHQLQKIQKMVDSMAAVRNKKHAIEIVIQNHNKLFLRNARVVAPGQLERARKEG